MINFIKNRLSPSKNLYAGKELEVDKWNLSEFILNKLINIVGTNPYPLDELMLMSSAVILCKPKYIIEWGTHVGKSARIFHEVSKFYKINVEIYTYDLPDNVDHNEHPRAKRGIFIKNIKNIHAYQADALLHGMQILIENNAIDNEVLFYIDGDHGYESVYNELITIYNKFPKANILLHDTYFQTEDSKYNIGPYLAINDFISSTKANYKTTTTNLGLPGMTLLIPS